MKIYDPKVFTANVRRPIEKISSGTQGGFLIQADRRIFIAKARNTTYNMNWDGLGGGNGSPLRRGINNAYELVFPDEDGRLKDSGVYGQSAYALFGNGNLWTWGQNGHGQLGIGSTTNAVFPTLSNTNVRKVYTDCSQNMNGNSEQRLLIQKTDGKIYGCGYNGERQLGLGNNTDQENWQVLDWIGVNPRSVWNLGSYQGCIIAQKNDNKIVASGDNSSGQLGQGIVSSFEEQVDLTQAWFDGDEDYRLEDIRFNGRFYKSDGSFSTNDGVSIIMLSRKANSTLTKLKVCGSNKYHANGLADESSISTPVSPPGTWTDVKQIATRGGNRTSVYALTNSNDLWGWGATPQGQLGDGQAATSTAEVITPKIVETDVLHIFNTTGGTVEEAGNLTSPVILKADGHYITGANTGGQTGTRSTLDNVVNWTKIALPGDVRLKFVSECYQSTNKPAVIGVDYDNNIWAWGSNGSFMISAFDDDDFYQPISMFPAALSS